MKIHAALSRAEQTSDAVASACQAVSSGLAGSPVDLAYVFFSPHHTDSADVLVAMVREQLHPKVLLGCSAESVIGGDEEVEGQPALCVWAAHLPGTTLTPFHLKFLQSGDGFTVTGWPGTMPSPEAHPSFLVIGEPYTTPIDAFLQDLAERYPGAPAIGGMASGGHEPGVNRLLLNDTSVEAGLVGVALTGAARIRSVVSQGCRPIGDRFMITRAEQNIIHELSGKPALERLQEVFGLLSPAEQRRAERAFHLGIVFDEHKEHFDQGDFLIRNLIGADQQSGSIAVGDLVKEGQTVQFQLRDAASASEELHTLLAEERAAPSLPPPAGALIFSCNGRGQQMFRTPHHDVSAVRARLGAIPVGGFFAMGEIGPVGRSNFLHSFTASVALFSEEGTP
jgi:small ligand-binding sensory domain FIST